MEFIRLFLRSDGAFLVVVSFAGRALRVRRYFEHCRSVRWSSSLLRRSGLVHLLYRLLSITSFLFMCC
jgi:hypothetical protein